MKFSKEIGYPDLSEKVFGSKGNTCQEGALLAESREIELAKNADANDPNVALNFCFQYRVANYLIKNNLAFKEKYADYYASLMGSCKHHGITDSIKCSVCFLHPSNNQHTKA